MEINISVVDENMKEVALHGLMVKDTTVVIVLKGVVGVPVQPVEPVPAPVPVPAPEPAPAPVPAPAPDPTFTNWLKDGVTLCPFKDKEPVQPINPWWIKK